jgi:hypothetical protein
MGNHQRIGCDGVPRKETEGETEIPERHRDCCALPRVYSYIPTEYRGRVIRTPASLQEISGLNIGPDTDYPD